MTQPDFVTLVETQLAILSVSFDLSELIAYVASIWPWMEDDPDTGHWVRAFIYAQRVEVVE